MHVMRWLLKVPAIRIISRGRREGAHYLYTCLLRFRERASEKEKEKVAINYPRLFSAEPMFIVVWLARARALRLCHYYRALE